MIRFFVRFLSTYDYTPKDFFLSMCPSFKYGLNCMAVFLSAITALINELIGIGPAVAMAMFIAVVTEMWTGISASHKRGEGFESFKFSRCIIKLCIWLTIIYIIHSFETECNDSQYWIDILATMFFSIARIFVMMWFVVEHVTSILENLAVIDGKPKDALVNKIGELWSHCTDTIKSKIK